MPNSPTHLPPPIFLSAVLQDCAATAYLASSTHICALIIACMCTGLVFCSGRGQGGRWIPLWSRGNHKRLKMGFAVCMSSQINEVLLELELVLHALVQPSQVLILLDCLYEQVILLNVLKISRMESEERSNST